jgi:beta-lactamase regulating signal transducer with metallopeptidase domain
MTNFVYSCMMSLLHSLWQGSLLAGLYLLMSKTVLPAPHPAARRMLLLVTLGLQVLATITTFILYYLQPEGLGIGYMIDVEPLQNILHTAAPWLMMAYVLVVVYRMAAMQRSWWQFNRLYKAGLHKPGVDLKLFTNHTAQRLGINRSVQLWLSSTIHTPVTFGYFKPIILLPVALVNQLSMQQAEALILHELTHISVKDYLINRVLAFVNAVYFFNPFIQYLYRHTNLEREKNCDAVVLQFGHCPLQYAEALLAAARWQQQPALQLAATGRQQQLLERIRFFTGPVSYQQQPIRTGTAILGMFGIMALSIAAFWQVQSKPMVSYAGQSGISPMVAAISPLANMGAENVSWNMEEVAERYATAVLEQQAITPEMEEQVGQLVEMALHQSQTIADSIANLAEMLQPVSYNDADLEKDVIIEEQEAGSDTKVMRVYTMKFKNGQWILLPKWKATAQKVEIDMDSLRLVKDSLAHIRLTQLDTLSEQ